MDIKDLLAIVIVPMIDANTHTHTHTHTHTLENKTELRKITKQRNKHN